MFEIHFFSRRRLQLTVTLGFVLGLFVLTITNTSRVFSASQTAIQSVIKPNGIEPNGIDDILGEGDDFARSVLGDPWNMDSITDIYNEKTQEMRDVTVSGGVLSGTTTGEDPGIYLLWPGFLDELPSIGKYGVNTPIQADYYRLLSFRMYASKEGNGQISWFQNAKLAKGQFGTSTWFRVRTGWHVYTLDLATLEQAGGALAWAGNIQGLRLDPINQSGAEIKLDWVRLTADKPESKFPIAWEESNGKLLTNLYTDTDTEWSNGIVSVVTTTYPSAARTFPLQTAPLPPGAYYVVTETGSDYASLTFDNSWDMSEADDIAQFYNEGAATFEDGILHLPGTREGWPFIVPRFDHWQPIDPSKFTHLTMRMYSSRADGWAFAWWNQDETPYSYSTQSMPTVAGWHTYTLDLTGKEGWRGEIRNIQIRPVYSTTVDIQIDWIALTSGGVAASEDQLGVERVYSDGPFTVQAAPNLRVTRPSMESGEDYATATFGQPWDMRNNNSIDNSFDLFDVNYNGDILNAATGSINDPSLFLRTGGFQTATPINADRYKYLTYRLYVEGKQDTLYGWVTRWLWWGNTGVSTHKDIVVNEGWNTYRLDLSESGVESNSADWKGPISALRFDPHETLAPTDFHLDFVYLRAADEADASFSIGWDGSYGPGDRVDLYYDTDTDTAVKTPIATGLSAQSLSYTWNTAAIPQGDYFIYLVARDGYNATGHYSETPVAIRHSLSRASSPTTRPSASPQTAMPAKAKAAAGATPGKWSAYTDLEMVTSLVADGSTIWAGTRGGIMRWDSASNSASYATTVDGLGDNIVYAGVMDKNGGKWFGTSNGVSHFDGQKWTVYTTDDGLADNRVYAVAVDAQGRKWFGTQAGLSRLDGTTWRNFSTADGLSNTIVRAIAIDDAGVVWAGTDGGGLSRFDGQQWTTRTTADGLVSNHIWALHLDKTGALWIGTDAGVSRYSGSAWTTYTVADGLAANYVRGIAQEPSGALWFATQGGGVSRLNGSAWHSYGTAQGLLDGEVAAVAVDGSGTVWAGSARGLNRFDGAAWTGTPFPETLADNYVTAIVRDGAGNVWFATPGGAVQFDGSAWRTYTTNDGLLSNRVQDIAFDGQGNRWFATDKGVSKYDGTTWTAFTVKNTEGQPGGGMAYNNTTALAVDRSGRIWMGSWLGVSIYDGTSWQTDKLADDNAGQYVYDLLTGRDGSVWIGTLGGIFRFHDNKFMRYTTANGLIDNRVRALAEGPDGAIWAGTYNGVSRFANGAWSNSWRSTDGLAGDAVVSAAVDASGVAWFGTYGDGVSRFDGANWKTYTTANGLVNNYVFAILPDNSTQRWFGTFGGTSRQIDGYPLYLPLTTK